MSPTGHSHVKNYVKKLNADLAGEMSGHIFADDYFGFDDAFYAAVKVIELINNNSCKLSELVDQIPEVFNTPEIRIGLDDSKKFGIISKIWIIKNQLTRRLLISMELEFLKIMAGG